ncbi:MAG: hypothetical protein ACR2MG_11125 [Pyrinomonadaceae bacterium]
MNSKQIYRKTLAAIFGVGILFALGFITTAQAQRSSTLAGGSPAMSYEKALLKREDVQNELYLYSLQKEFLTEFVNQTPGQMAARAIQYMPPVKYVDITKLSEEERKQWIAEIGQLAAAQTKKFMEDERREVESVLRPEQKKRLHELDLQWRGILALSDSRVADEIDLSTENRKKTADIVADFEVQRINLISRAAQENKKNGGSQQEFIKDFDNRQSPLYQKRQELLQEFEKKVFDLLSEAEKDRWRAALGKPFIFSDDAPVIKTTK